MAVLTQGLAFQIGETYRDLYSQSSIGQWGYVGRPLSRQGSLQQSDEGINRRIMLL